MNATHYGTYLPYPDLCNCCEYCLAHILEGGSCTTGSPGTLPPTEMCGPGLSCVRNPNGLSTCQKMTETECTKSQKKWDEDKAAGSVGYLEVRPKCDNDGLFASSHCIPGSICYCVSPEGERIFGESAFLNSWDETKMTCGCSINHWKAQKTIDMSRWEKEKIPVFTARCTEHGLFDQLQCMLGNQADCACVNPIAGNPNTEVETVKVKDIKEGYPSCFDPKIHMPGSFLTDCEFMRGIASGSQLEKKPLFNNPICQPDGMFHRVQIMGSKKICVDPSGIQIDNYAADVDSLEASVMHCNCARTVWLLSQNRVSELPKCCSYGNFERWQHRRSQYYCVDENGDQVGLEEDTLEKLSCYKNSNGQPCPFLY
ncbi:uncharacterized protein [Fopius arisanus]|nr:PREDICTED: uncharacterized protein LOC105270776 isoform X2 [Fopius arisanus]